MKNRLTSYELADQLEKVTDKHLSIAVEIFQNATEVTIYKRPKPEAWNAAQCLHHLNSYGQYYLPELKLSLVPVNQPSHELQFTSTWLGNKFTEMMQPGSGKKYSAFKGHIPPSKPGMEVVAEFINQQEELIRLLRIASKSDLNINRIGISILPLIRLKPGDVLRFLIAHNDRHVLQALRAMEITNQ